MSEQVQQIAKDIETLSPLGKTVVKSILADGGDGLEVITSLEHLIKTHVSSINELKAKRSELTSEIKEKQLALSDYLIEYKRMTEANQLSLFDGSVVDIVVTAKVAKKQKN